MLAGLQGSGKTTLAGKLAHWLKGQGHAPLLVACDLQRPQRGHPAADRRRAGRGQHVRPEPGNGVGDPVDVARRGVAHAREKMFDIVIVDTAAGSASTRS
jgi:signal recognition particle subunit SRP54